MIDAPVVCPGGQKPDQNGKCREEWSAIKVADVSKLLVVNSCF